MTSTIKVNNIQNQCGANIINENSNTITIGASGDTIALASGASQSGFGRTGTVDWQTGSIKTSTFTAASGEGYFCNTTSGGFTVNLPAGTAGAIVSIQDYNNTFDSNALTIDPNGSQKINGGVAGATVSLAAEGQGVTFVYVDDTVGWRSVQENEYNTAGEAFISATGGTITTSPCGSFKIHTFTGPGTFCVSSLATLPANNDADYLVIAAGGGGGANDPGSAIGGAGGGAGGYRESPGATTCYTASPLGASPAAAITLSVQGYPIAVGAGGAGGVSPTGTAGQGAVSSALGISSAGGGGGHSRNDSIPAGSAPMDGGSGGGQTGNAPPGTAGSGNTPSVSPSQGFPGGNAYAPDANSFGSGGGGGATAAALSVSPSNSNNSTAGGAGATSSINGSPTARAGGGGGGGLNAPNSPLSTSPAGGAGGNGGGGAGGPAAVAGTAGTANTGGGGGGAGSGSPGSVQRNGGTGGSGVVIIRYRFA